MKRFIGLASIAIVSALCVAVAAKRAPTRIAAGDSPTAAHPLGKLVVHEWGTFTGFAGSDGVHLPFNTLVGSDLPPFVSNRQKFAERVDPRLKMVLAFTKGGGAAALQRMETPVIYFYADAPGEVNVRVGFPQGLLTEFYPPVQKMGPKYGGSFGEYALVDPTTRPSSGANPEPTADDKASFLDWGRVRIVPRPTGDEGKHIAAVTNQNHYEFARNTDSDLVQFTDKDGTRHEEKFLFYRGLGNFTLPVKLTAIGNDRFELQNSSTSPIASAFLIQIAGDDHKATRFARFENLAGNQKLTLPSESASQDDLSDAITKSLISNGLYEKEARAMVATWKDNWLNEPGTRVLYILPRSVTDAMLPLRILPAPDQAVRVLVGRIDVLTPEMESRLWSMMMAADASGMLSKDDIRTLNGLGKFLTPTLERVSKPAGEVGQRQVGRLRQAMSVANSR